MTEFLKMDVFFVVATLALAIIAVLVALILIRVLRILKNVEEVSDIVSEEAADIRKDIDGLRSRVKQEGLRFRHLLALFGLGKKRKARKS